MFEVNEEDIPEDKKNEWFDKIWRVDVNEKDPDEIMEQIRAERRRLHEVLEDRIDSLWSTVYGYISETYPDRKIKTRTESSIPRASRSGLSPVVQPGISWKISLSHSSNFSFGGSVLFLSFSSTLESAHSKISLVY
jgi:hypothetical protein